MTCRWKHCRQMGDEIVDGRELCNKHLAKFYELVEHIAAWADRAIVLRKHTI